jgi:hypothetical protein
MYVPTWFTDKQLLTLSQRSDFDFAVELPDPCPIYLPVYNFLNQEWVQQDLGVPLNFTYDSTVILSVYSLALGSSDGSIGTGDPVRRDKSDFDYALNNDIQVSMVFGDRDYRCNWLAGEALTLNADYPQSQSFITAGYEKIVTNSTYDGGVVRQHGQFSFARIFDAGHSVSAYQPDTVYQVFQQSRLWIRITPVQDLHRVLASRMFCRLRRRLVLSMGSIRLCPSSFDEKRWCNTGGAEAVRRHGIVTGISLRSAENVTIHNLSVYFI